MKRTLDVAVSAVGLLIALPVIAAAIVAVKLRSPGPGLHRQRRVGRDGVPFTLLKVRTMVPDADRRLELILRDPELRVEWERRFKLEDDPRVVRGVGTFLRRWSLDELPQLWNVLRGDMSLVGPRPLPDYHLRVFTAEARELRQRVRPGMTGLWQVTTRADGSAEAQQPGDEYYVRNGSIWLDLFILARTVVVVLGGGGVH